MSLSFDPSYADVNAVTLAQGVISVGTTQVAASVGVSNLSGRQELRIHNKGPYLVYWGPTGVTTSSGEPIYVNQTLALPYGDQVSVFVISGTASSSVIITESA
jgi:hypothetical protein